MRAVQPKNRDESSSAQESGWGLFNTQFIGNSCSALRWDELMLDLGLCIAPEYVNWFIFYGMPQRQLLYYFAYAPKPRQPEWRNPHPRKLPTLFFLPNLSLLLWRASSPLLRLLFSTLFLRPVLEIVFLVQFAHSPCAGEPISWLTYLFSIPVANGVFPSLLHTLYIYFDCVRERSGWGAKMYYVCLIRKFDHSVFERL